MDYQEVRAKLLGLFDMKKLEADPEEWGFTHEKKEEINLIAAATNLNVANVELAAVKGADLLLTHHDCLVVYSRLKRSL